jgi:Flp pilus assembly protein TadG
VKRLFHLVSDTRGAGVVEFALILPALMLFVYGIFVVGQLFQANAGMQHGLGEGARYATLCLNPSASMGCTVPSNTQIQSQITSHLFGGGSGTFSTPTVTTPSSGCTGCRQLSITYSMPMDFLLISGPTVTITRTKIVYVAA